MEKIYLFLIIGFGIIQIAMIIKFFQIANDVRVMKEYFVKEKRRKPSMASVLSVETPAYEYKNGVVYFSDGLSGKMKYNLMGYGIGGGRYFGDKEEAVKALYVSLQKKY